MVLYSFFNSSTSYRVRIALALKGLTYELRTVNLRAGEQRRETHRYRSPMGGVPVLIDDAGRQITQSLAILEYLDAIAPEPRLFPLDPLARAQVQELALLVACDIHPLNNLRVLKFLTDELAISAEDKQRWYAHWIAEGFAAMEVLLGRVARHAYCFGEAPGAADCCLVPQVANALRMGCDVSAYPRVMSVYRHCVQLEPFKSAAPERQPDYQA
jgi:maleylacetoacetate isomerase